LVVVESQLLIYTKNKIQFYTCTSTLANICSIAEKKRNNFLCANCHCACISLVVLEPQLLTSAYLRYKPHHSYIYQHLNGWYVQTANATGSSNKKSLDSSEVMELMARLQADAENREDVRQQRLLEHEARMEERRLQGEERRREKEEVWRREQREWDRQQREKDSDSRREREAERRREAEFSWESKRREREMEWERQRREKEMQWEEQRRERELQQQQQMLEAMLQTIKHLFQQQHGASGSDPPASTGMATTSASTAARAEESTPMLTQQQQAPGVVDYAKIMSGDPETLPFDQPLN